jgi:hypothetical protein
MDINRFSFNRNGDFGGERTLEEHVAHLEGLVEEKDKTIETLQSVIQALLISRQSNNEEKKILSVSERQPLPEEDKTINRIALCSELVRVLLDPDVFSALKVTPKLARGEKADKPRVYLMEDNSFLYFDEWGRLYARSANKISGGLARSTLKQLYQMRDYLPSPVLQASLLKTQFNAGIE